MGSGKGRASSSPPPAGPRSRDSKLLPRFRDDLRFWVNTDPRMADRLLRLVEEVMRDPFGGIGKPEPLRSMPNTWSRRLSDEHRMVYRVSDASIDFLQARFHYSE